MNISFAAAVGILAISFTGSPAYAKTVSATIKESAAIVPGSTVSAYLIGGHIVTSVAGDAAPHSRSFGAAAPAVEITFDTPPPWHLIKHVTWDKSTHKLTVDF